MTFVNSKENIEYYQNNPFKVRCKLHAECIEISSVYLKMYKSLFTSDHNYTEIQSQCRIQKTRMLINTLQINPDTYFMLIAGVNEVKVYFKFCFVFLFFFNYVLIRKSVLTRQLWFNYELLVNAFLQKKKNPKPDV